MKLTDRQAEVLAFMREYFDANDQLPPCPAIQRRFGFASANAAPDFLKALAKKGAIERNACGRYRFARPGSTS